MREPYPIGTPSKIAVAAAGILLITAVLMLVFGDRQWKGLETLITASTLVPLSTVSWPLVEMGGNRMLFGIDAARQAIWQRQQRELAEAREEGRQEGREEGYQKGYDAGVATAQGRRRRRRILRNDR